VGRARRPSPAAARTAITASLGRRGSDVAGSDPRHRAG
jgi:hypothetical protein